MPNEAATLLTPPQAPQAPTMGRLAWAEPEGNKGHGKQWFPLDFAFKLATFYKRGAPARTVWIEFPDGTREEVTGE